MNKNMARILSKITYLEALIKETASFNSTIYYLYSALVRRLLEKISKLETISLESNLHQVEFLNKEKWNHLIILDACRYDVFRCVVSRYLEGKLFKATSAGSNTYEWLPKVFSLIESKLKKNEITIF